MDIMSLIGFVLAAVAVVGGCVLKGTGVSALWSSEAFVVVIIGTCAAIMVQTPVHILSRALRMLPWVVRPPRQNQQLLIEKIVAWSDVARKQGLLGLETTIEAEADEFTRKGLQLLVDGSEPEVIRGILEVELTAKEHIEFAAARVFEGMGTYAPTMGIIGAVMGLMAVMAHLSDPSELGAGIAAAFVATIYGIASANLLLLPVASKLKGSIQAQNLLREMIIEGLISIAQGENPRNLETKLQGYVH